jgi:hypothetical protein
VSWDVHPLVVARAGEQISISNFYIGRGAPELGSGRNPDFLDFRFRPELVKKAWPEPELCRFQRDRISNVFVSNKRSQ